MSLTVDEAFEYSFCLPPPSPAIVSAITAVPDFFQAVADLVALPEVQSVDAPIVQMFELATGHDAQGSTFSNIASSGLTQPELAAAFVASQTFADNYNGGTLVNPNAPVSARLVMLFLLTVSVMRRLRKRKPRSRE